MLVDNEILLARGRCVGIIAAEDAINGSLVGPMLRGSGVPWDLRKAEPYCGYERFDFEIPVGRRGDAYDRFLVRLEEVRQSTRIIRQALDALPSGPHKTEIPLALRPDAVRGTAPDELGPQGDSMSLVYRLWGRYHRPIGERHDDGLPLVTGEKVHFSAMRRLEARDTAAYRE